MKVMLTFILIAFINTDSLADVEFKAENGFLINIEKTVKADVEQTYYQFIRIQDWWDAEHSWFGHAEGFRLEPKAGGCFCEKWGDGEVLHMTVSFVSPKKEIRMLGGLGPLQVMGVYGAMTWQFEQIDENKSKIKLSYQVSGFQPDGLDKLAEPVDSVLMMQINRLIDRLENKDIPKLIKL